MEYFGIDVGGTQVKWAVVDEDYAIVEQGKIPTDFSSAAEVVDALVGLVEPYRDRVGAIAASVPGTVQADDPDGTIIGGGALTYMDKFPLGRELTARLGLPAVIDNDGKSCANGEYAAGALKGTKVGVVMVIGTGLGGGVVIDGTVFRGAHGNATEISGISSNHECPPGKIDLGNMAAIRGGWMGLRGYVCAEKGISPEKAKDIDGVQIFKWVDAGDEAAIRGLHTYARYVVSLCHTLQVVLDPDAIAIGGGISAAPALIEAIHAEEDALYEGWPFPQMKKPNIVLCKMGNDANIIGAVYEARRRLQI